LHPLIIHWFERELFNPVSDLYGKSVICIYCEYKRDKINFHAHPNFRQSGAWHDWVMVAYESDFDLKDDPNLVQLSLPFHCCNNPSKIMCFFVVDEEEETCALVQSCCDSNHQNNSCLFQRWSKEHTARVQCVEPMLRAVPVDSFGCRIFVVEDDHLIFETIPTKKLKAAVMVVKPCDTYWPRQFLSKDEDEE